MSQDNDKKNKSNLNRFVMELEDVEFDNSTSPPKPSVQDEVASETKDE